MNLRINKEKGHKKSGATSENLSLEENNKCTVFLGSGFGQSPPGSRQICDSPEGFCEFLSLVLLISKRKKENPRRGMEAIYRFIRGREVQFAAGIVPLM